MNDRNRGGMTISSLLMTGLFASVVIPIICLVILGFSGAKSPTTLLVVGLSVVILLVGLVSNYMIQRKIKDRLLNLVDVCRNFVGGDRSIRASVNGDDENNCLGLLIGLIGIRCEVIIALLPVHTGKSVIRDIII